MKDGIDKAVLVSGLTREDWAAHATGSERADGELLILAVGERAANWEEFVMIFGLHIVFGDPYGLCTTILRRVRHGECGHHRQMSVVNLWTDV